MFFLNMIISRTPLRISFFGGGTDFPDYFRSEGGIVLSSAIDKYVYVVLKDRFDDKLRVSYSRTEEVNLVSELGHELIRESLKKTGVEKGIEIITMGDVPGGSGLGSSSAVTVGALQALYFHQGVKVSKKRLAQESCEIEIDILKKPIGYQDQYIASFGGIQFIEFRKNGKVDCAKLNLSKELTNQFNDYLLLFFTGTTRKAESILSEQKDRVARNLNVLDEMKRMAEKGRYFLSNGEFTAFGNLLSESWELKKTLASGISNDELDDHYQNALKAGASGGKITGAGGGGFLMLVCNPNKKDTVRSALSNLRELPFRLEPDGTKIIFK